MTDPGDGPEESEFKGERRSVALFFATFAIAVYLVYPAFNGRGEILGRPDAAWAALQFSVALMAILLSHEMAHYWVAKAYGFSLSLPYFLPFPAAFGMFGAIIRVALTPGRLARGLLEMVLVRWPGLRSPSSPSCSDFRRPRACCTSACSGTPPSWTRSRLL